MRQSGGTFHLADDRIKRAVGVLRRAEIAQARVRLVGEAFQKRGREPRFADAGLAGEQHHLAFTGLCPRPTPQQQFEFFFPPDEGSQAGRVQRLEAALHGTCPQRRPGPHRPGDALEVLGPEVLKLEEIAEESSRAFGDDDLFGSAIPCRRAARFGVSPTMPRSCASPEPIRSPTTTSPVAMPTRVCSGCARSSALVTAVDQLQPRPYGPLGIILMRLRIAEIHEHAIAHVSAPRSRRTGARSRRRISDRPK